MAPGHTTSGRRYHSDTGKPLKTVTTHQTPWRCVKAKQTHTHTLSRRMEIHLRCVTGRAVCEPSSRAHTPLTVPSTPHGLAAIKCLRYTTVNGNVVMGFRKTHVWFPVRNHYYKMTSLSISLLLLPSFFILLQGFIPYYCNLELW